MASTIVDKDGTSHVRLNRTYRGLQVVGGDLVVHQTRGRRLEGQQPHPERGASTSA